MLFLINYIYYLHTTYPSISKGEVALLQQQDSFFSMLTPRETIQLAAFLQLKIDEEATTIETTTTRREEAVDRILDSLGLRDAESRRIGQPDDLRGFFGCLSGGERRRLSVGK